MFVLGLESDVRVANISQSLAHKMAENSWPDDMKKLRYFHPMYCHFDSFASHCDTGYRTTGIRNKN